MAQEFQDGVQMNDGKIVPRPGVGIMILNGKGEVLLGKRHDDPGKAKSLLHGEGTWTLPGGKLDFGERLDECALREVLEETGIKARKLEPISISDDIVHDAHFVTVGFLCREFEGEARAMEPDEITEWKWFPISNLPDRMFPPAMKIINNYKGKEIYQCQA